MADFVLLLDSCFNQLTAFSIKDAADTLIGLKHKEEVKIYFVEKVL